MELQKIKELTHRPHPYEDYVWSDEAACYDTSYRNGELTSFLFIGCWVKTSEALRK